MGAQSLSTSDCSQFDRPAGIARGVSVLVDLLEQDHADDEERFFDDSHRGVVSDLLRYFLDILVDEAGSFVEVC